MTQRIGTRFIKRITTEDQPDGWSFHIQHVEAKYLSTFHELEELTTVIKFTIEDVWAYYMKALAYHQESPSSRVSMWEVFSFFLKSALAQRLGELWETLSTPSKNHVQETISRKVTPVLRNLGAQI